MKDLNKENKENLSEYEKKTKTVVSSANNSASK